MKQARETLPNFPSFKEARSHKNAQNPIISPKKLLAALSRGRRRAILLALLVSFLSVNLLACGRGIVSSNLSSGPATATTSSGTAWAMMKYLSCESGSMTGAGTDNCTATLTGAAPSGGQVVNLASDNAAVTVPSSVTVASGAITATFTATITAVSTAQAATLTGTSGGVDSTYAITLNANSGSTVATLTLQSTSVAFGNVVLNAPSYQTDTLTSSGTAAVTISAASLTGTGFSISGVTFPLTLNPGQTAQLQIEFDPTTAVAASGKVTLTTNCSSGSSTISLSGTGETATQTASYEVSLSWDAPSSSPVGVTGYNIYRATGSSASYQLINSSVHTSMTYIDSTVASNTSYSYYVESVDAAGGQSIPSNNYTVSIP
jgi:hypothetical protein